MKLIRSVIVSVVVGVIKRFDALCAAHGSVEDREFWDHYGFSSRPKPGAEVLYISDNNKIHAIASADRRYEPDIAEGESVLYTHENIVGVGHEVRMKADREVEINCKLLDINTDGNETRDINGSQIKNVAQNVNIIITQNENKTIGGYHSKAVTGNIVESGAAINITASAALALQGATVVVRDSAGNKVEIGGAETKVYSAVKAKVQAPVIELAGAVTVNGALQVNGAINNTGNIASGGQITDIDGYVHSH